MNPQRLSVVRDVPRNARRSAPKTYDPSTIVGQVRIALKRENRLAAVLGGLLGAGVPVGSYQLAHHEITAAPLWTQLSAWLVLGGLVFSALTVFQWGKIAFVSPIKAVGFCVLLEGILVGSATPWLSFSALIYLCCINAVATGCNLANKGAT
jgi:hypothetical protein